MALLGFAQKIFGSSNDRRLKPLWRRVEAINALEDEISKLSDDGLIEQTEKLKQRYKDGESLDSLLEEAFATVQGGGKTRPRPAPLRCPVNGRHDPQ